jgi:hypothetical protein
MNRWRIAMRHFVMLGTAIGTSSVTQTLTGAGSTIAPNTEYVLSVDVADNAGISKALPAITDIRVKDSAGAQLPVFSFVNATPGNTQATSFATWVKTYRTGLTVTPGALTIVVVHIADDN